MFVCSVCWCVWECTTGLLCLCVFVFVLVFVCVCVCGLCVCVRMGAHTRPRSDGARRADGDARGGAESDGTLGQHTQAPTVPRKRYALRCTIVCVSLRVLGCVCEFAWVWVSVCVCICVRVFGVSRLTPSTASSSPNEIFRDAAQAVLTKVRHLKTLTLTHPNPSVR